MALFESYERRIDKINSVLNSYGIASIEEAEKITKDAGLDVYEQVREIGPVGCDNACCARQSQSRKAAAELPMRRQRSARDCRHSVFRVP